VINSIYQRNFYAHFKAINSEELIKKLDNEKVEKSSHRWATNCKVKTLELDVKNYINLIGPNIDKFSELLQMNIKCSVTELWVNRYENGYHQEIHDHCPNDFSAVFFLNSGKDFSNFYFYDRNLCNTPPRLKEFFRMQESFYPEINAGDMIIFPSNMLHGVTPHNGDVPRKTMSFNLVLTGPSE